METIVIVIPWALVAVLLLFAVSLAVFLVAFLLWARSARQEALSFDAGEDRERPPGQYCPHCGAEVLPSFRFCADCARRVRKDEED